MLNFLKNYKNILIKFSKTVWFFPAILTLLLILLTAFRISGTSVGVYEQINGAKPAESGFLLNGPRGVRSDEWLVNTQMIVAQSNNNFKMINDNIGRGQDMSLFSEVPYAEWSILFKPQNLIFFGIPLEYAFAFKWWFILYVLMLSFYLLSLVILEKKKLFAVIFSLFASFSPFFFWWYLSGTLLTIAYANIIISLFIILLKSKNRRDKILITSALTYCQVCFALIMYPPFQIPIAIVMLFFLLGWVFTKYRDKLYVIFKKSFYYVISSLLVALFITLVFFNTRSNTIDRVTGTIYPGNRIVESGGITPLLSFSSFLQPNLQYDEKAASSYFTNQSEASNFIFIAPFLMVPTAYVLYIQKKRNKKLSWDLTLVSGVIIFFLLRMYVHIPLMEPIYKVFFLQVVSNQRLVIGLGFAGLLQILILIREIPLAKLSKRQSTTIAILGALSCLVTMCYVGKITIHDYPVFIKSFYKVLLYSIWISLSIIFIFKNKIYLGLITLLLFSAYSIYKINPFYQGLSPLTKGELIESIQSYPDDKVWITIEDRLLINFPIVAGKKSLSGVQYYPQLEVWDDIDPTEKFNTVYNRYAHVVFSGNIKESFNLKYADLFEVKFEPCGNFLQSQVTYVLSPKIIPQDCVELDKKIELQSRILYIYKIVKS